MLHFDYEEQLTLKKTHLIETMRRVGGFEVDPAIISSVTPSTDRLFYRGKIELACRGQGSTAVLGLRRRVSPFEPYHGEVVPIDSCAIFSPQLSEILPVLRDYIARFNVAAFDERSRRGFLKEVTLRESKSTGDIMLILDTARGKLRRAESLIQLVQRAEPSLKSICRLRDGRAESLEGQGWIEEAVGDLSFHISPAVFFQPNPKTARLLYKSVIEFTRSIEARRVIGLYCGMGTLEMTLSRSVEWVEGYDSELENIRNARRNCEINGIGNCRFHARTVEEINLQQAGRSFDLAVVDPPRTGMSRTALKSLADLGLPAIAYVSCDPATLSRDLKVLITAGYRLIQVMPFDFFPHTSHLETLVFLQKQ